MNKEGILLLVWQIGAISTLIYVMFFDSNYNWWNWIILIPCNLFLATIWPIFWLLKLIGIA